MEEIEERALSTFDFRPVFWKRYVDDTCTILPVDTVSSFHQHLNQVTPHIQFTVEIETDGCLPFLDVLLCHQENRSIQTSVYLKPTHTNKYLDVSSHHPLAHKSSLVRTLCTRAKSLSSSQEYLSKEMSYVRSVLSQNGYPEGFVKKAAKTNILSTPSVSHVNDTLKPAATVVLPYIKGLLESISRVLDQVSNDKS